MARLLLVNVWPAADIQRKGRTVHTGIWKDPVSGRRRVRRLNLDGERRRLRFLGGPLGRTARRFADQIESYRHWQEQAEQGRLRPRRISRRASQCPEDQPDHAGAHRRPLSDRQRLYPKITQPRATCYRVGIRDERDPHGGSLRPVDVQGSTSVYS